MAWWIIALSKLYQSFWFLDVDDAQKVGDWENDATGRDCTKPSSQQSDWTMRLTICCRLAQLEERRSLKAKVRGSRPRAATKSQREARAVMGPVCKTEKDVPTGSTPVRASNWLQWLEWTGGSNGQAPDSISTRVY